MAAAHRSVRQVPAWHSDPFGGIVVGLRLFRDELNRVCAVILPARDDAVAALAFDHGPTRVAQARRNSGDHRPRQPQDDARIHRVCVCSWLHTAVFNV